MKVRELIEVLQGEDGEVDVALYCDHGQELMNVTSFYHAVVLDSSAYMMETPSNREEVTAGDKVFIIEST